MTINDGFRRTLVGLKRRKGRVQPELASFRRTLVGLKRSYGQGPRDDYIGFRRTLVGLKPQGAVPSQALQWIVSDEPSWG